MTRITRKAKIILLPAFETSEMVQRVRRRIRSKTVRQMSFLSHHKFKQRLIAKAAVRGLKTHAHARMRVEAIREKIHGKLGTDGKACACCVVR